MNEPSKAKPSANPGGSAIHNNAVSPNRKDKGRAAEEAAASYMEQQGWLIVERNWTCRSGELDIIAEKEGILLFVEVRSRSGTGYGLPAESIDGRKIQQVRRTAEVYLHRFGISDRQIRFDAVAVMLGRNLEIRSLEHIEDAF